MIRFIQIIQFLQHESDSSRSSRSGSTVKSSVSPKEPIDALIKSVKDWQAQLILVPWEGLDFSGIDSSEAERMHSLMEQIPDVKLIVLAEGRTGTSAASSTEHPNWPQNLIVLHEFESIFLEDLGLLIHGGFFMEDGNRKYFPELVHLDPRWPNILVLPDSVRLELTRERIAALHRFDYTTLQPWLKDPELLGEELLIGAAKDHLIFGTLENGQADWLIRQEGSFVPF